MPDSTALFHSATARRLFRGDGRHFDGWAFAWREDPAATALPGDARPVAPVEALRLLAAEPGIRRLPVGVLGPRTASPAQYALAESLGRRLGETGLTLICGGRSGVMEAVCKGCLEAGGAPIGILPDEEWSHANRYVAIPLATGLGSARNAVIARAAAVLIAIGGGYGTLSEIAFGLRFGRPVLALPDAPAVEGVVPCPDIDTAMAQLALRLLQLEQGPAAPVSSSAR